MDRDKQEALKSLQESLENALDITELLIKEENKVTASVRAFFKAVHRSTGEEILFSLGDIELLLGSRYEQAVLFLNQEKGTTLTFVRLGKEEPVWHFSDWLKDYELFYQHQGEWFRYE